MSISIPELSLVVLIGTSGSGKSTFARQHFLATEILSSDYCRSLVSDDENDQSATKDAFEVLHFIAGKRLAAGRLTVVDATNVQSDSRKPLVELARKYHCIPVALVFDISEKICQERNKQRNDRNFGNHVIRQQSQQMRRSIRNLKREGFRHVFMFSSPEEMAQAEIKRQPLWNNLKNETGPFDIIGDVHGCFDELTELLGKLGYQVTKTEEAQFGYAVRHPESRKIVFLGDLVDRGPGIHEVLRLAMSMHGDGTCLCVPGNHDIKLMKALQGRNVQVTHGLADSLAQLERASEEYKNQVVQFIDSMVSHYVFDGGKLVVAHAGMKEEMQGRGSGKVRDFALYGETTGETDEFGLPERVNWAAEYRGKSMVVYGHMPVAEAEWINRTIDIDTGCVFGGKLTALRYPERELVSVPARQIYYEPQRPLVSETGERSEKRPEDILDIEDVLRKSVIKTRLHHSITIREENARAALEVMSRFTVNPRWLIYLPPTMSPSETTSQPGMLEHPEEAFAFFKNQGVEQVICEQKHMGSRAVVIVGRNGDAISERFGISGNEIGTCYTRTGRPFFDDKTLERSFLDRVRNAVEAAGLWEELKTDWVCLDCELMPWSMKAQELLRQQYASVGAAAREAFLKSIPALAKAQERGIDVGGLVDQLKERSIATSQFVDAYRQYCWPVKSLADIKLAPFHLLAAEGKVYNDRDHSWHMETLARICKADEEILLATPHKVVSVNDPDSRQNATGWWQELTGSGGEGMVVKPLGFTVFHRNTLVQPAIKCRGKEYLRIIYGAEYTLPGHLERLKSRGLSVKRSLALREFALGIEALERFVNREPLYHVHECAFGVLALESEPVDPRL